MIDLPLKLYKYQSYNVQTLGNLKNRRIWFSKPARFNDPFDCAINFDFKRTTSENWNTLYQQYKSLLDPSKSKEEKAFVELYFKDDVPNDEFKSNVAKTLGLIFSQELNEKFQSGGVACFSEKPDDILMWSHYSDGHRGFCLEIDTSHLPFSKARPVEYSGSIPPLKLSSDRKELMWDLVTTKSIGWSYEKEWRIFHEEGDKEFGVDIDAFTGVYFGCAMPKEHKETISELLKDTPTKIYESRISETEFRVEFHLIK